MIYLLDANVLIDANRDYYPLDRVPEFWEWLLYHGNLGEIKTPIEVYEELVNGNDSLARWANVGDVKSALVLDEEVDIKLVQKVLREGYSDDLIDTEVIELGRDPFFIAYALRDMNDRVIVTTEVSKPSRRRAKRHVPNVCDHFHIPWCNTFEFIRALDFSTNWKEQV